MSSGRFSKAAIRAATQLTNSPRLYHSLTHLPPSPYTATQIRIFNSALNHVPDHGFVKDSLVLGCRDQGYLDSTHAVFHNGVFDLIQYHLYNERTRLASLKEVIDLEENSPHDKARRYCIERLKANQPFIERWPEVSLIVHLLLDNCQI